MEVSIDRNTIRKTRIGVCLEDTATFAIAEKTSG
jgi:hypothetical protein